MAPKRIILITGANQGVGYDASSAIAAASPDNHVIMGCRNASRGAKALQELQSRNPVGTLSVLELDVTNDDSIASAAQKITNDFGVVDVLINNAGICVNQPQNRRSELRETLETNSVSPVVLTETLLPLLKKSQDPRIINVTSGLGSLSLLADPNNDSYTLAFDAYRMSKAALNMATLRMYMTYRSWGAKVWAYCPGYVVTNLTGEENRQARIANGAESAETSAKGILEIVEGKRDGEVGSFITKRGGRYNW